MYHYLYRLGVKLSPLHGLALYMNNFMVNIMNNLMNNYWGKITNNFMNKDWGYPTNSFMNKCLDKIRPKKKMFVYCYILKKIGSVGRNFF